MKPFDKARCLLLTIAMVCSISMRAIVIYSTTTGGNWNTQATWEGGQVPGSADDVVISDGATVNAILGAYTACHDLLIENSAILTYNGSGSIILTVNGSLVNNGTIRNGTGNLELIIYRDVTFMGLEFSNFRVRLRGTYNHSVYFDAGLSYTGSSWIVDDTPRQVYGNTGLSFSGVLIDFNGSTLVMAEDCRLTISGQSLNDITLSGTSNELEMNGGAYLQNSTLTGSSLYGIIRAGGGTLNFPDGVTIAPGTILENYGSTHTVYINGSVTNYGTITNTSNFLNLHITGDIHNDGTWENQETILTGDADQYLTFGDGIVFTGANFYSANPLEKSVYALTDLEFQGTNINFAWGEGGGVRGTLIMQENGILKVSGSGSNKVLNRVNIASQGNAARIWMASGAFMQSFSNTCNKLVLEGCVQAGNSEIYVANNVYVMDTLTNFGGTAHTLTVNGNLTNMGYITNGTASLEMQISGNVNFHGIEWSNNRVTLSGISPQSIDFAPFSVFTGAFFETANAHDIQILSDLSFQGTQLNFDYSNITFLTGTTFHLDGTTARLINAHLFGDAMLYFTGGAYLGNADCNGNMQLSGTMEIYNNSVFFNGQATNTGILHNQNASAHTTYVQNDFYNDGTIENGAGMGNLTLELKGNIFHDGTWTNYENKVNGTVDQHIRLNEDKPVNAKFILYSNLGGSGFQWYKDDLLIPGANSINFSLNQITTTEYGLYYCLSSEGQSRIFTINRYMDVDFSGIPVSGCQPLEVHFTDQTVSPYPVQSWSWSFGDGGSAILQNPSYQYIADGSYDVALTVSDSYVSKQQSIPKYITVNLTPVPDFSATSVALGNSTGFTDQTTNVFYDEQVDTLFASEVISYSSQWSSGKWSAQKVLGEPDVYPTHADDTTAWASLTENGQREYLELRFSETRIISQVIIYETLYPGTVDTVYVKNPATGLWELVWSGTALPQPLIARAFTVSFPLTPFTVNEIRIALNSPAVPYWNEIDAVAIVSPVSSVISTGTTYLWDIGENGVTFSTKGSISYTYQTVGEHTASLTVMNNSQCDSTVSKVVMVYDPPLVTWNGSVDSDWNNLANWTPAFVPVAATNVIIPDVTPNPTPVVDGAAECNNLTMQPGSNLIIASGNDLVVHGTTYLMAVQ